MIDPGLYGDAYADRPFLYGPALSSLNSLRICGRSGVFQPVDGSKQSNLFGAFTKCYQLGSKKWQTNMHSEVIEEGGEAEGALFRREMNIPDQAHQRQKYFLQRDNRQTFWFEPGVDYKADFGNGYIDFQSMPPSISTSQIPSFNPHGQTSL
jgi:hypothetical protein